MRPFGIVPNVHYSNISAYLNMRYPKSPIDIPAIREDLADVLSSAGELANVRASKVVNVRTEQHTALDLPAFWTLFNVSWDFVVRSEVICKRMIVALRGVLVSQVSESCCRSSTIV